MSDNPLQELADRIDRQAAIASRVGQSADLEAIASELRRYADVLDAVGPRPQESP